MNTPEPKPVEVIEAIEREVRNFGNVRYVLKESVEKLLKRAVATLKQWPAKPVAPTSRQELERAIRKELNDGRGYCRYTTMDAIMEGIMSVLPLIPEPTVSEDAKLKPLNATERKDIEDFMHYHRNSGTYVSLRKILDRILSDPLAKPEPQFATEMWPVWNASHTEIRAWFVGQGSAIEWAQNPNRAGFTVGPATIPPNPESVNKELLAAAKIMRAASAEHKGGLKRFDDAIAAAESAVAAEDKTVAELKDECDHWRVKAKAYGDMVQGCSPTLATAGFPVDASQADGAIGGIARAVEALAKDRDSLRAKVAELRADRDNADRANQQNEERLTKEIADLRASLTEAEKLSTERRIAMEEKDDALIHLEAKLSAANSVAPADVEAAIKCANEFGKDLEYKAMNEFYGYSGLELKREALPILIRAVRANAAFVADARKLAENLIQINERLRNSGVVQTASFQLDDLAQRILSTPAIPPGDVPKDVRELCHKIETGLSYMTALSSWESDILALARRIYQRPEPKPETLPPCKWCGMTPYWIQGDESNRIKHPKISPIPCPLESKEFTSDEWLRFTVKNPEPMTKERA